MAAKKKRPNEKDTGISGSTRSLREGAEEQLAVPRSVLLIS
jgi:hypothetical protein